MKLSDRIADLVFRLSNIICFIIVSCLMLWLAPAEELLRNSGLQADLIRVAHIAMGLIPALIFASVLRSALTPAALEIPK